MKDSDGEQDGEEKAILLEQGTDDRLMQPLSVVVVNKGHGQNVHSLCCKAKFRTEVTVEQKISKIHVIICK